MRQVKIFILLILAVFIFLPNISLAQGTTCDVKDVNEMYFRPNVEIPGMDSFFDSVNVKDKVGSECHIEYKIDNGSMISYVQSVYSYAAIFAGVLAMFMLVFAAYQWLLAGGNAEKIGRARDTISGVLLGLTLLFGGNLLLSQISNNLVEFQPLKVIQIKPIAELNNFCLAYAGSAGDCNRYYSTTTEDYGDVQCLGQKCNNSAEVCVSLMAGHPGLCPNYVPRGVLVDNISCGCFTTECSQMTISGCDGYQVPSMCESNSCFAEDNVFGFPLQEICYWDNDGGCKELTAKRCTQNADCIPAGLPESEEAWCCKDQPAMPDTCGRVSAPYDCVNR